MLFETDIYSVAKKLVGGLNPVGRNVDGFNERCAMDKKQNEQGR